MKSILKEVLKEKDKIKKSFGFKLWSKDHQKIFLQGYDCAVEKILEHLEDKLNKNE